MKPPKPAPAILSFGHVTAVLAMLLTLASCTTPPSGGAGHELPPPADRPDAARIAATQNDRVARLRKTYSYGVLELRWKDDAGVHSEPQVDVDIWLDLPDRTAIRVNKLGEVYFWLGSDASDYWLFDLLDDDERVAVVCDRHDERAVESMTYFGLHPESLLDLMGLRPIPDSDSLNRPADFAPEFNAWVLDGLGRNGRTRMFFEVNTLLPIRVELRSAEDEILVFSTLSHDASVARPGVSVLAYPRQAMWIDIVDVAGDGFARIHLNEMTADVADQPFDRVFDLDRLITALRPDRIERLAAAPVAGSGH